MRITISGPVYSPANSTRPRGTDDPELQRVTVKVDTCPGWQRPSLILAQYDEPDGEAALRKARAYVRALKLACEEATCQS